MPRLTTLLLAGALLLGPAAGQASAVTIADLINLKANGLSDAVLIALIESDGSVFKLSADEIIDLRKRGLSNEVIIAMVLTAKKPVSDPAPAAPAPSLFTEGVTEVARQSQSVQTPHTTVNVHQTVTQTQTVEQPSQNSTPVYVPYAVPYVVPAVVAPIRRVEPVYWGFGGKRRADSWVPRRELDDPKPDPRPDPKPDTKSDTKTATAKPDTKTATTKPATRSGS